MTEGPDEDRQLRGPHGTPVTRGPSVAPFPEQAQARTRVLVVEDDPDLRSAISRYLAGSGFSVASLADGRDALNTLLKDDRAYEVLVLDLLLPGLDGVEVCRQIRRAGSTVSVLMATALGSVDERIAGLRGGADDYLAKPFSLEELALRVRALARRRGAAAETALEAGDLRLDLRTRRASRGGVEIDLTRRELQLLELFMRRPGLVLSREAILRAVWGPDPMASPNLLEQHIAHLRQKVDRAFGRADIETLRRLGYRLRVAAER